MRMAPVVLEVYQLIASFGLYSSKIPVERNGMMSVSDSWPALRKNMTQRSIRQRQDFDACRP